MKKRIAFVQAYPYESFLGGDGIYIANFRRYLLERGHEVTNIITDIERGRSSPYIKFYDGLPDENRDVNKTIRIWKRSYLSTSPRMYFRRAIKILKGGFRRAEHISEPEMNWLRKMISSKEYDIVFLFFNAIKFSEDLDHSRSEVIAVPGFIDTHLDMFSRSELSGPQQISDELLRSLRSASIVCFNNQAGIRSLEGLISSDRMCILGMSYMDKSQINDSSLSPHVLLVGAKTNPNIKSADWFIARVWPKILKQCPDARLRLVGRVSAACIANSPSTDYLGQVEDIDYEYSIAKVVVAPLTEGSEGVKTKVVEAFSFGRPLVATSIGIDIELAKAHGKNLCIHDDEELFADSVSRLLLQRSFWLDKASVSKQCYADFYSAQAAYGDLASRLNL